MDNNNFYNREKNKFTDEMINDTIKYQRKYGFEIGENDSAWNNESDAFRHAYMQAILLQRYNLLAKNLGNWHETMGNLNNQDPKEYNMDSWNNNQGLEIFKEIQKEYPYFKYKSEEQQKDIIAKKVVQRMKKGLLITNLEDSRKFQEKQFIPTRSIGGINSNGKPIGFASDIKDSKSTLSGYTNPITGSNRIFTREDISSMSNDEFENYENEIMAQLKSIGVPTNGDMERESIISGDVVYVNSYTRSDGTNVKGYYRSKPKN